MPNLPTLAPFESQFHAQFKEFLTGIQAQGLKLVALERVAVPDGIDVIGSRGSEHSDIFVLARER